jgi:signal transduction histidine kinase/YHS domain-containing protein
VIHAYFWEFCCILGALLLGSNLWLYFRVLRPIQQLAAQANELSSGNFHSIDREIGGIAEIQSLRRSMASMVKHVRRAQQQSVKYADNLTEGQEAERLRIARELHDDTIQSLIAISQSVDMAKTWIQSKPAQATQMLSSAREQAVETVSNLRGLIEDLRPPALEELGLAAALEMQSEKCDFPVKLTIEGHPRRLNEAQELALFRCAQEALSNARRHSQAKEALLRLSYYPQTVQMAISDNGKGFTVPGQLTDLADGGHYGLMGVQERVKQLDGTLEIRSALSKGTYIRVEIPSEPIPQPEDAVRDPVCSAVIQPQQAYASSLHDGERYYFCCPICQGAFQKEPERYTHRHDTSCNHTATVEAL